MKQRISNLFGPPRTQDPSQAPPKPPGQNLLLNFLRSRGSSTPITSGAPSPMTISPSPVTIPAEDDQVTVEAQAAAIRERILGKQVDLPETSTTKVKFQKEPTIIITPEEEPECALYWPEARKQVLEEKLVNKIKLLMERGLTEDQAREKLDLKSSGQPLNPKVQDIPDHHLLKTSALNRQFLLKKSMYGPFTKTIPATDGTQE